MANLNNNDLINQEYPKDIDIDNTEIILLEIINKSMFQEMEEFKIHKKDRNELIEFKQNLEGIHRKYEERISEVLKKREAILIENHRLDEIENQKIRKIKNQIEIYRNNMNELIQYISSLETIINENTNLDIETILYHNKLIIKKLERKILKNRRISNKEYITKLVQKIQELESIRDNENTNSLNNDKYIIAKFSKFTKSLNNKKAELIKRKYAYGSNQNLTHHSVFLDHLDKEQIKTERVNYSGVASIVCINKEKYYDNILKTLYDDTVMESNTIDSLLSLNIKNIFIIRPHNSKSLEHNTHYIPRFLNISSINEYNKSIGYHHLTLECFCLLYSNLLLNHKEINSKKAINLSPSSPSAGETGGGVLINGVFTLNPLKLYQFINENYKFNQSIFIFKECKWNDIVANFKLSGLDISGGSQVKRHVISPMDYTLSLFLSQFLNKKELYKEIVLSQNLNQSYLRSNTDDVLVCGHSFLGKDFSEVIVKSINMIYYEILESVKNKNVELYHNMNNDNNLQENLKNIILNNIIFNKTTTNNLKMIQFYESFTPRPDSFYDAFLQTCKYNLQINKNNMNNVTVQNILTLNPFFQQIRGYSTSHFTLLNPNHNSKQPHLPFGSAGRKVCSNIKKNLTLPSLISIGTTNFNKSQLRTHFCIKYNYSSVINVKLIDKQCDSSNNTRNVRQSNMNEVQDLNLNSSNDLFYNNLKDLIKLVEINPEEAQLKIESEWIDIKMKEYENEKQQLRTKYVSIMNKAKETLAIKKMKLKLKKEFGNLGEYLDNFRNLFITISTIIESYQNESHTMVAYNVGYNIMRELILNNKGYRNVLNNNISIQELIYIIITNHNIQIRDILSNINYYIDKDINSGIVNLSLKSEVNKFYVKLGILFIDIFIQEPLELFELDYPHYRNNKKYSDINKPLKIIVTDKFSIELANKFKIQPKNLPMVCVPNE